VAALTETVPEIFPAVYTGTILELQGKSLKTLIISS
jgi:hypothetical protein